MIYLRIAITLPLLVVLTMPNFSCAMAKAFKRNPKQVGELVPCSTRVARKLTELIKEDDSPKRIIEVGAGSGAITAEIIKKKLKPADHLDIIEIDEGLCEVLRERFGHLKNVTVRCTDFLKWNPDYQYDYVVSTLPFNSFPPELVTNMLNHFEAIAKNNAPMGFVELKWMANLGLIFLSKDRREQIKKTREIVMDFYKKHALYQSTVYINFPPIIVYLLKLNPTEIVADQQRSQLNMARMSSP